MMTTYSFLLNTTYYDSYTNFWQSGNISQAAEDVDGKTGEW